jgi:hypothetical protein
MTPTIVVALAVGALLGWLAASGGVIQRLHAQDKAPEQARPSDSPAHWDELTKLPFPNGYPTEEARTRLMDEFYFQRAVQVYLAALPAVNMLAMRDGSQAKWGDGYSVFPVWKMRMNARTLVTTPNADVIYAMTYLDLKKDGPLAVIVPPMVLGMFTDFWQRALTDVGPAGPDKGQGGLYLLLPPDYEGPVPGGYHPFRSPTYNVFMFWRTLLTRGRPRPRQRRAPRRPSKRSSTRSASTTPTCGRRWSSPTRPACP